MPVKNREYLETKKIKANRDLDAIRLAQVDAIDYLQGRKSAAELKTDIANITSIASIAYTIFGKSNAAGIAIGLIAFVAAIPSKTHKQQMIDLMIQGNLQIQRLEKSLKSRGQWDATIGVELAFLESKDYHTGEHYFTGVTDVGAIKAYYDGNGNVIPNP